MSDADHERRAVELVMGATQYAETLDALVERTGRTAADLRADSQAALTEMSAYVDESASRIWDRMGRWLTRSYEVDVDTQWPRGAGRAGAQALAGVPAQPPLLPRPAGPPGGHGRARPAQQLHPRRDQPRHVAALGAREAERADLHPPLQPRRPGLPGHAAPLPGVPAAPARQPRVVLRGRSHPHRQAPAAADGGAALPRRRLPRQRRGLRRRLPRAGLDRLRPAARGLGPVRRRRAAGARRRRA